MSRELRLLIDTNVWLDLFVPHRQGAETSRQLLVLAHKQGHHLLYEPIILCDVYRIVCREAKSWVRQSKELTPAYARAIRAHAWDCVSDMCTIATAVGIGDSDVWLARKHRAVLDDLEDDFVLAAAQRARVDYLVSSDSHLLRVAPVAAHTPTDMLAILEACA